MGARGPAGVTEPSTARAHFAASNAVASRFFREHADDIARAAKAMAHRFQSGGRLLVWGSGAQRSDVGHVVVEFLHPVVVGKRALPAIALPGESSVLAVAPFCTFAGASDMLLLLCAGTTGAPFARLLEAASRRGVLSLLLAGDGTAAVAGDHVFVVPSRDAFVVQETHEILYHVLWELTHVFLDHRGSEA